MKNPFDPGFYGSDELRSFGFAHVGDNVQVAKNCTIIGLQNISIGDNSRIDSFATLIATGGKLTLAGRNHIGGGSHLLATANLYIGEFSGTSQGVRIYTGTDDLSGGSLLGPCVPREFTNYRIAPVYIDRHCSVSSGAVILPGVVMEEGAVLGALSMAIRRCKAWTIYSGVPARKFLQRKRAALDLEAELKGLRHAA